jgi:tripartite-type tricarboxylate transporter receptor subunit TctC
MLDRGPKVVVARWSTLWLAVSAAALTFIPCLAAAQVYPDRPVRILVGFPPGGNNDIHARLMAQWLSERLRQQFIVENRAGAAGNLATETVVRAASDGYTLLHAASNDSWNAALYENLKFNFIRDVVPVASVSRTAGVLVVHPSIGVVSVAELVAYARSNPGKLSVASLGVGSSPHIYWQLLKSMSGVDMLHVPYRSAGQAMTALLTGEVHVLFSAITSVAEHVQAGKLRALAVTADVRSAALPETPTMNEFVPGYEATGWQGVVAPKGTPVGIVDLLNREINAALADPRVQARIADAGATPFASSPAEFGRFITDYTERWSKVIRTANIKAE